MKCPKCGRPMVRSKKNPSYGLCYNCKIRAKWVNDYEDDFEDDDYEDDYASEYSNRRSNNSRNKRATKKAPFKTWKLVSGILSIVLFVLVSFQSCAAGLANTLEENGEVGGSAGIIVAIMLLVGGIVSIATKNGGKGGNIAIIVVYGIGALFGFALAGGYSDLYIWSAWCLVCVIMAIVTILKSK